MQPVNSAFKTILLQEHNRLRSEVGVPSLEWSDELQEHAQLRAAELAGVSSISAAGKLPSTERESLHHSIDPKMSPITAASQCLKVFGARKQFYTPGTPVNDQMMADAGLYLQMVWKDTKFFGAAMASGNNGMFVVCRYSPPGNVIGEVPYDHSVLTNSGRGMDAPIPPSDTASPLTPTVQPSPEPLPTTQAVEPFPPKTPLDLPVSNPDPPESDLESQTPGPEGDSHQLAASQGSSIRSPSRSERPPHGNLDSDALHNVSTPWRPTESKHGVIPNGTAKLRQTTSAEGPQTSARSIASHSKPHPRPTTPFTTAPVPNRIKPTSKPIQQPKPSGRSHSAPAPHEPVTQQRHSEIPSISTFARRPSEGGNKRDGGNRTQKNSMLDSAIPTPDAHGSPINDGPKKSFGRAILAEHNKIRQQRNVRPLRWSAELESHARQYAQALAHLGRLESSSPSTRPGQGETLYFHPSLSMTPVETALGACQPSSGENKQRHRRQQDSGDRQHAQMVYPGSTHLGAGMAIGSSGTFVVCRYSPEVPTGILSTSGHRSRSADASRNPMAVSFKDLMMHGINSIRKKMEVPILTWSSTLEVQVENDARMLVARPSSPAAHSLLPEIEDIVHWCKARAPGPVLPPEAAKQCCQAIKAKVEGQRHESRAMSSEDPAIQNYSQAVCSASKSFAAATAIGPRGTVVVCRFHPHRTGLGILPYKLPIKEVHRHSDAFIFPHPSSISADRESIIKSSSENHTELDTMYSELTAVMPQPSAIQPSQALADYSSMNLQSNSSTSKRRRGHSVPKSGTRVPHLVDPCDVFPALRQSASPIYVDPSGAIISFPSPISSFLPIDYMFVHQGSFAHTPLFVDEPLPYNEIRFDGLSRWQGDLLDDDSPAWWHDDWRPMFDTDAIKNLRPLSAPHQRIHSYNW